MKFSIPNPLAFIKWRIVVAALISVGILHILATLATPSLTAASAYARLKVQLPANKMVVLDPLAPDKQVLPFLSADSRYAMCRFDMAKGPVAVAATLPDAGWSLALYTPQGDNFYVATGTQGQRSDLSIMLVSTDERFMGLTPEARGLPADRIASLPVAARQGLAVIRAPDRGHAFKAMTESMLKLAACSPQPN